MESVREGEPGADAPHGPGGYDNIIWRVESQELSTRNRISEEVARSELQAMEEDTRNACFHQDQPFRIAVREYQRQARGAVNHAVQASSESYEVLMMQKVQGVDEWKKMKEEWHKCLDPKHEKLYEVREATCWMNIKYFSQ